MLVRYSHRLGCSSTVSWCSCSSASLWQYIFTSSFLRPRTKPSSKYKMSLGPPKKDMTSQLTESDRHCYQLLYKNIDPHSGPKCGTYFCHEYAYLSRGYIVNKEDCTYLYKNIAQWMMMSELYGALFQFVIILMFSFEHEHEEIWSSFRICSFEI